MNKKYLLLLGLLFLCEAKTKSVSSVSSFNRAVGKSNFAVVMLYDKDRQLRKENPEMYERVKIGIYLHDWFFVGCNENLVQSKAIY